MKDIEYCCYFCDNLKYKSECKLGNLVCYNAMGGLDYIEICEVKVSQCAEKLDNGRIAVIEAHKDCWKRKVGSH